MHALVGCQLHRAKDAAAPAMTQPELVHAISDAVLFRQGSIKRRRTRPHRYPVSAGSDVPDHRLLVRPGHQRLADDPRFLAWPRPLGIPTVPQIPSGGTVRTGQLPIRWQCRMGSVSKSCLAILNQRC